MQSAATFLRPSVEGYEEVPLGESWQVAATEPGARTDPGDLEDLNWFGAAVPGTAAGAMREAGLWNASDERDMDAEDWWFRTRFKSRPATAGEEVILHLGGIATVADVFLNGEHLLRSDSMFIAHALDVSERLAGDNELAIRCLALAPLLRERRRPRARWRTRLVAEGNLRFFRTMVLGRAPGFAPGPAAVGPWRAVSLQRRRVLALDDLRLQASVVGADGRLTVRATIRALCGRSPTTAEVELDGPSGTHRTSLLLSPTTGGAIAEGAVEVPSVTRWWPHTHGDPALHEVRLLVGDEGGQLSVDAGRVGFRSLAPGPAAEHDVLVDGVELHVNGIPIFARGAVWTPIDPVSLAPVEAELRAALEAACEAGMNMVRVPGTSAYESSAFYDLCDELGILVWQDFMFANLDYPITDDAFRAQVEVEAAQVLDGLASRPSVAVLCGNSEVEQQAAMFGVDPAIGRGELFGELLPSLAQAWGSDAVYVPSAPCGGDLPFRADVGVANYYGVGGYRRGLDDARRSAVRFAAECLAFANVPSEATVDAMLPGSGGAVVHDPSWKAAVARDVGSDWDFEDVRDHYLELLFGLDPVELRSGDPDRYLELSRAVSGEVMSEVFGEWRRAGSPCGGGLVLWMRDLVPGAGWGLFDSRGEPKVALRHLRRAMAPVAIWTTDEGLGGVGVHVANDGPEPLLARIRVGLYRDLEQRVGEAEMEVEVAPHTVSEHNVEAMLGRFVDASYAYRFGPPQQDLIVVSLERDHDYGTELISQSMRFPAGRPSCSEPPSRMGVEASATRLDGGAIQLEISTRRLAYGVRIHAPGFRCGDDAFGVEPGGKRTVRLRPRSPGASSAAATLTALNLDGYVRVGEGEQEP